MSRLLIKQQTFVQTFLSVLLIINLLNFAVILHLKNLHSIYQCLFSNQKVKYLTGFFCLFFHLHILCTLRVKSLRTYKHLNTKFFGFIKYIKSLQGSFTYIILDSSKFIYNAIIITKLQISANLYLEVSLKNLGISLANLFLKLFM